MSYIFECNHEIFIKDDDKDLLEASKFFLKNLEKDYKIFLNEYKKEQKKWNDFFSKDSKGVFFIPEFYNKKSPITIIDSKWGNGKTFFVEHLGKNIKLNKVETIFNNFVIIDIWNFFNSDDMVSDILDKLFYTLCSKKDTLKKWFKKACKFGIKKIFEPALNSFLNTDLDFDTEKIDVSISEIKFDKTIIVFDNVERMGENSWEVMKLIQKLSMVDNFVFLLPMDATKIYDNENKFEKKIEKFIDLPSYNLKQDYSSLLNSFGFKRDISITIDKLFNIDIGKKFFSIREFKKIIQNKKLFNECKNMKKLETVFYLRSQLWKIDDNNLFLFCIEDFNEYYLFLNKFFSHQLDMSRSINDYFEQLELNSFFNHLESFESKINSFYDEEYDFSIDDQIVLFLKENKNIYNIEAKIYEREYVDNLLKIFNENYKKTLQTIKKIVTNLYEEEIKLNNDIDINDCNILKKNKRIDSTRKKINKQNSLSDPVQVKIINWENAIQREENLIIETKEKNYEIFDQIELINSLTEDIKLIKTWLKTILEIIKKHNLNIEKNYKENMEKNYEFEIINNFFFNLNNRHFLFEIFLEDENDNLLQKKAQDFFKENFNIFINFFEKECQSINFSKNNLD